jgi:hypothetical protein
MTGYLDTRADAEKLNEPERNDGKRRLDITKR